MAEWSRALPLTVSLPGGDMSKAVGIRLVESLSFPW